MAQSALILGAGVAGLSAALYLRRAGWAVTVLDPLGPAGGASYGNAGLLSPQTVVPAALPGMWKKVPGWLGDPLGPVKVRTAYLPRAAPWLLRWIRASGIERVRAISDAMAALHAPALDCWRDLLGEEAYRELMRPSGQVQVWEGAAESATAQVENELRARHNVRAEKLGPDDLRQLFPGIARDIRRGLFIPDNGHTVSPGRAVKTLAEAFLAEGGTILPERALKLVRRDGGWFVLSNTGNHLAEAVVVAGGAWSGQLLAPLGIRLPLETERGYHAHLPGPSIELRLPILQKTRGFGLTPMEDGLRAAGTVEIAGLDAPPDERRAALLADQAKRLFPELQHGTPKLWMGYRPSFPDSLPVVGPAPGQSGDLRGLFLCFGHGHFGMTGGPPSGQLVAALVAGTPPPVDPAAYSPARFG